MPLRPSPVGRLAAVASPTTGELGSAVPSTDQQLVAGQEVMACVTYTPVSSAT